MAVEEPVYFILRFCFPRFVVCSLSIKVLLRIGRYLPSRGPESFVV